MDLGDNESTSIGSSTNRGANNSPISKLPPELLIRIFEHHVAHSGPTVCWYNITHVCHQWRELAVETSWLWTTIPTDPDFDNPNWTRIVLERSKTTPLNICLIATPWKMNLAVYRHISHIRTLSLQYFDAKELEDMVYILSVIGDDAKELADLQIWGHEHEDVRFKLPPTCFRGASMLEYLDLQWVDIDWHIPFLAQNLYELSLQYMSPTSIPSWAELLGALARMPRLGLLTLKYIFPETPVQRHMERVHLPCLQQLTIAAAIAFQIESFFSSVTFPPLQEVAIFCDKNNPGSNNYLPALQSVSQRFPPSTYGRFNVLEICLSLSLTDQPRGVLFSCRTFPNDTESGGGIEVVLGPTVDVSTERIIGDILDNFSFHHNLTLLKIDPYGSGHVAATEFVPAESLCELFGSMPNLESIAVSGNNALSLIQALTVPLSHPFGAPLSFPALRKIDLRVIDMERDKEQCDELEDILMARYEYGREIQTLHFIQCFRIDAEVVARFAHIVTDFFWSEDSRSQIMSAMRNYIPESRS